MKRSIVKSQSKIKTRSRNASEQLIKSIPKVFSDKRIPIAALTGLSKKYSKRVLDPSSSFVKRFTVDAKNLNADSVTKYLSENTHFQKGQTLSDDAIKRAHAAFCNNQGRMTFEYIMKRCEELGVAMNQKLAKGIVRRYGKGKDYLSAEDCAKVIHRRNAKINPQKRGNTPKKNRASTSGGKK